MVENFDEESLEQLRYLQSLYAEEYENLLREISNYTLVYNATKRNVEVLENLNLFENGNILLNLEGGTYIAAKVSKIDKVLVYVGSNYLVEKSADEAKEFLKNNQQREEEILKELNEQKGKLEKELLDIAFEIEKSGSGNV